MCSNDIGLINIDTRNDDMTCIQGFKNRSLWIKFDLEDANEAKRHTGWEIVEAE